MVVVKSTSTLPPPQTFFSASQLKNGKLCSLWGGFEEKKVNEGISVQTTDQAPFKDEAYENYWGKDWKVPAVFVLLKKKNVVMVVDVFLLVAVVVAVVPISFLFLFLPLSF